MELPRSVYNYDQTVNCHALLAPYHLDRVICQGCDRLTATGLMSNDIFPDSPTMFFSMQTFTCICHYDKVDTHISRQNSYATLKVQLTAYVLTNTQLNTQYLTAQQNGHSPWVRVTSYIQWSWFMSSKAHCYTTLCTCTSCDRGIRYRLHLMFVVQAAALVKTSSGVGRLFIMNRVLSDNSF